MEKATLTPFSKRGRGSAFSSQKTSWLPSSSRFVSEEAAGGAEAFEGLTTAAEVVDGLEALGLALSLDVAAFFAGCGELHCTNSLGLWFHT